MATGYKYQALRETLLEQIRNGDLRPGDRLPSQRQLMAQHKVSYATVTAALNELARAGLIASQHGKGNFVTAGATRHGTAPAKGAALCIGLMLGQQVNNPSGILKGIHDASQEAGFRLEFIIFHGEKERRQRCQDILDGKIAIDGILCPYLPGFDDVVAMCREAGFPCVVIDTPCRHPGVCQVLLDHEKGSFDAVEHLIRHGHERIGLLVGPQTREDEEEYWGASKRRGYKRAMSAHNLYDRSLERIMPSYAPEHVDAALSDLLKQDDLTALFVAAGNNALQVLDRLREQGKRVPRDIAVVSFNVTAREEMDFPEYALSGIDVPRAPAGEAAVRLLAQLIAEQPAEALVLELPLPFIRRRSCGCA